MIMYIGAFIFRKHLSQRDNHGYPNYWIFSKCITVTKTLTFFRHAYFQAFLQPAVLAAVPRDLVDDTALLSVAGVHHVLLNAPSKKALRREARTVVYYGWMTYK